MLASIVVRTRPFPEKTKVCRDRHGALRRTRVEIGRVARWSILARARARKFVVPQDARGQIAFELSWRDNAIVSRNNEHGL